MCKCPIWHGREYELGGMVAIAWMMDKGMGTHTYWWLWFPLFEKNIVLLLGRMWVINVWNVIVHIFPKKTIHWRCKINKTLSLRNLLMHHEIKHNASHYTTMFHFVHLLGEPNIWIFRSFDRFSHVILGSVDVRVFFQAPALSMHSTPFPWAMISIGM